MLAFLPAISLVLIVVSLRPRIEGKSWREAFLAASVLLGTTTVLVTEGLSLFHLVALPAIVSFWAAIAVGAGYFAYLSRTRHQSESSPASERMTGFSWVLLGGIAAYVLVIALIAFISPPNTGDSFEYHMPKILQWVQNRSTFFFPTAVPRQNHLAPGTEYAILHLQILSGSDRFANFVEWLSMLGSLAAVSLIARQLGAKIKGQLLAAAFAVSFPMGIMQASSTQTDYVVAFWFVCFAYYVLRLLQAETDNWYLVLAMSGSLGMAVFSKAVAYVLAPAFLLWLVVAQYKTRKRAVLRCLAVLTLVFFAINGGHLLRNWQLYGSPLGPGEEPEKNTKYSLDSHAPKALLSSLSKNVGTHLGTPWPKVNTAITNFYIDFHKKMGWDVNDPRTSWGAGSIHRFAVRKNNHTDENDGNPVHFLLAILCGFVLLLSPTLRKDERLLKYGLAVLAGALLFAFYLKWHPWMSRLHVSLFVLAAPLVGLVLARIWNGKIAGLVAAALLVLGIPWLLYCQQRPLVGQENIFNTPRIRLYFQTRRLRNMEPAFTRGKDFLLSRNPSQVGLMVSNSSVEYWWWVMLRQQNPSIRFQQVSMLEPSSRLAQKKPFCDFRPDAVLALDQKPWADSVTVGQLVYTKQWQEGRAAVYLPMPNVQTANR